MWPGRCLDLTYDPQWELAVLATVNGFYQKLLHDYLEGEIPAPMGLDTDSLTGTDRDPGETVPVMRRWLSLLDMAITPAMLRRGLTPDTDPEIAEVLLRYFAHKKKPVPADRDKSDLIATFLYRFPRVAGQWQSRGSDGDAVLPAPPFEIALTEILADSEVQPLSEEEIQILSELEALAEEADQVRDFDALVDAGIVHRARKLKQALGSSFYHPGVLATIAPYNAAFGKKFDLLFRAAATQVRNSAEAIRKKGGEIVGQVDGSEITVELVAAMDLRDMLQADYEIALERMRHIVLLKKALERKPTGGGQWAGGGSAAAPAMAPERRSRPAFRPAASVAHALDSHPASEDDKIKSVEGFIRAFVRAANPKLRDMVPMRFFNLPLTKSEVDAYLADYAEEDSFRGDYVRALMRIVALIARMSTEIEEIKRKASKNLWKTHAQSLSALLEAGKATNDNACPLLTMAQQRGLADKVKGLLGSLQKLRQHSALVRKTLAELK